jgi:tetratricopeptide (TPR) repeat protein
MRSAPLGAGAESGPIMNDAALRDELEGVDFYIAQGYLEIARDTLDRLSASFPDHPDIQRRYQKLKSTAELKAQMERIGTGEIKDEAPDADEAAAEPEFDLSSMFTIETVEPEPAAAEEPFNIRSVPSPFSTSELPPIPADETEIPGVSVDEPVAELEPGPVGFELSFDPVDVIETTAGVGEHFEIEVEPEPEAPVVEPEPEPEPESAAEPDGDVDLLDDLLDNLDTKFAAIDAKQTPSSGPVNMPAEASEPLEAAPQADESELRDSGLNDIFEEFKSSFETDSGQDYDTHYNLGIAYRDMELLDDAIEEFQSAIRTTSPTSPDGRYIQCCNMLGLCFMTKDMPRLAVMWYRKGLDAPNRPEDEYQALRFDLGLAYERMGDIDHAMDVFSEVYAIDINYRDVSEKLRELQAAKKNS